MKKKIIAILLTVCLMMSILPVPSVAADTNGSGMVTISQKEYAMAPGITEYELITNNEELSAQQVGHVMEVRMDGYSSVIAGYKDYNIEAIASGNSWGMLKPTEQAQNAETRRGVNVVGAVNGDFFNMSNGAPTGVLVMDGSVIKDGNSPCFWVDSDNNAHISESSSAMYAEAEELGVTVAEAIGANTILVQDGQKTVAGSTYGDTANPRTVVGIKEDGTVVIYMVNGRQSPYSVGMVYGELADIMLSLGCEIAANLDGGGSSVFATQREGEDNDNGAAGLTVRCRPSDGYERSVSSSLLVVSYAEQTGEFDHAVLSPQDEVYTPGSQIPFTAVGVDVGGGPADLPTSGLTWSVTQGADLGSIDSAGVFTANEGKTGTVEITLSYNGTPVGSTSVELQWPDKLSFTNTSVSLDFGERSSLSFTPTYKGRDVHYKDGDFVWSLEEEGLSYKYSVPGESVTVPCYKPYDASVVFSLTGEIGALQTATVEYNGYLVYETTYKEESRDISVLPDGTTQVAERILHQGASLHSPSSDEIIKENITEDFFEEKGWNGKDLKVEGIKQDQTVTFSLGQFRDNQFIADEETSLKGTATVALATDSSVSASIDLVVGMEPVILMDFEAGHTDPRTGEENVPAEEYWKIHVGMSDVNGGNSLSLTEREEYRLMIRDTTGKGVQWPENPDGSEMNGVVSAAENSDVRFGNYAMQLAWDFSKVPTSQVAAADFGFSSMVYAHVVQPTKIGLWINVPADLADDPSQVKMIFAGGITEISDTTESDAAKPGLENAYWDMDAEGNLTWHPHELPLGTTQYLSYYSYDTEGNITGSQLKDWAGKGWTWIEADLSGAQFPIGIQYGYTVRIVSPQNDAKSSGSILIDNLQLIYGANTNDVNNPVVESITETSSGTELNADGVVFNTGSPSFEATYSDSELTDKYASGIDNGSIRVEVDGQDYTQSAEITAQSLRFSASGLVNGSHSLTIYLKDLYGNESSVTRRFTVNDDAGANAEVDVVHPQENPTVAGTYTLSLQNVTAQAVKEAEVTLQLLTAYTSDYTVTPGDGYEVNDTLAGNQLTISATKTDGGNAGETIATISFQVPETAQEGDVFRYTVTKGSYTTAADLSASFSKPEVTLPLTAAYQLTTASTPMVNVPTTLVVLDAAGEPVADAEIYQGNSLLGTTDAEGELEHTFTTAGRVELYAKNDSGRSWNTGIVVSTLSTEGPFAVQCNASEDGATSRNITWLSPIGSSLTATTQLRLSTQDGAWDAAQIVNGKNEIMAFTESSSGTALRLNSVSLIGLTPSTTYFYQVGDGTTWSGTYSFTTASDDPTAATNFFVFGDIQTDSTANLAAAIGQVCNGTISYDFGIQTGDAIDNVTTFANWRGYLTVLNGKELAGIDMIHTMGNHEYYGDAEGKVAGSIFSLPNYAPGSVYSTEYGSVYVAVVNNGGDLKQALEQVKQDAAESDCIWKVLVVHEPIYGTVDEMDADARKELTQLIEEAGIDFVFSGDDHAYARTAPLKGDTETTAEDGVVYYVCGDLSSKDNEFHAYDYFEVAMPHNTYTGMYLSVQATEEAMTITAYDYNGNLLDSYTKTRSTETGCEHTFGENSRYDLTNGTVTCESCGVAVPAAESGYTGVLYTTDEKNQVMLALGVLQKDGWFAYGEEMCHIAADGLIHSIVPLVDTSSCLKNGWLKAECTVCHDVYTGAAVWAKGHTWNENHVCTACGTHGIDIAEAELTIEPERYSYTGSAIRPTSNAIYNGKELDATSDRNGTDAYITYQDNTAIGVATVTYEGRGNFYGSISATFTIVPASVQTIQAEDIGMTSVTLRWNAAKGAQTYLIQQKDGADWIDIGSTANTTFTVDNLADGTDYTFRVYCTAVVDGAQYNCISYSDPLEVTTVGDPLMQSATYVTAINCTVPGETLHPQIVGADRYFFLPSSASLEALPLKFTVEEKSDAITLSGDLQSLTLDSYEQTVNIKELASPADDGSYEISVSLGDLRPFTITVMQSANIPAMYLTSTDPENAGRDFVDAEKGNSATANMILMGADGNEIYNGELTQLKSRGNSTFTYYDKKSYQIKLGTKSDLLGTGETVKTWVLLAGYGDATQMHDKLFKDFAAELGMPYVPSADWVDLYYDGEYRGTYLLSEKNSIGDTAVDITDMEKAYEDLYPDYGETGDAVTAKNSYGQDYTYTEGLAGPEDLTGGYLLELNHDTIDEANGFHTRQEVAFNIKGPEFGSNEAVKYISEYYQEFEDAVYAMDESGNYTGYNEATGKYYYDYCDLDSLVQMYLVQLLGSNSDAYVSSLYFYKDAGGKLYAGPIWDMEMTCGTGWSDLIPSSQEFLQLRYLTQALVQIPSFQNAVKSYFQSTFLPAAEELLGSNGAIATYQDTLTASVAMNYVLWPYVRLGSPDAEDHLWADGTTYNDVVADMSQWLDARLKAITKTYGSSSGGSSSSGGGAAVTKYGVSAPTTSNGSVSVSPSTAAEGDKVTITVTPNTGYKLDTLTVTDKRGNTVELTKVSENKYTFQMPDASVTVKATFQEGSTLPFADVAESNWFYDAVAYVYGNGMMNGTGATKFAPSANLTRGMIAQVLYNLESKPDSTSAAFNDVAAGQWYADAVNWAAANDIVSGYGDGTFGPENNITREQMALILYRYAAFKGYDVSAKGDLNAFTDGATVSAWAKEAMTWAVGSKLLSGKGNGILDPTGTATRAEVAQILQNFCEKIAK